MDKLKKYMEENGYSKEFIEQLIEIGKQMAEEIKLKEECK